MSLLSIIKQGVSQVSDLISKQPVDSNSDSNSVNKSEKGNWFADLFNKPGTQTPGFNSSKQSLNQLSTNFLADNSSADVERGAQQRISERDSQEQNKASLEKQYVKNINAATVNLSGDNAPAGYVQVPVVLPHNYPTPMQESRAILVGLKFKDSDIKAYNEHYKTDLVKEMSVGLGKNVNHNAGRRVYVPGEKKDVYVGYIAIDAKTHKNLKDFIAARRTGGELPAIENNNTAKATNKQSNIKLDPVTVTVLAGGGAGLAATMIETMPSQIATDIVPRAIEAGAKVAPFLADVAVPATIVATEALPTVFIAQHAAQDYMEAKGEHEQATAARNYDAARELAKATTATMTMDDAEPQMQPVPEAKPKSQPYAEPQAKPQAQDLPDAPTDTTIAPLPKAKSDIKADDLPQPYTPDVPKGTPPQIEPPNAPKNLDRIIPPIIVGTAASKAINNAMNNADLAPNGVGNIHKREWTKDEYQQWFENLPKRPARTNEPEDIYQIIQTGNIEYTISTSDAAVKLNADGITDKTVLEAKFIGKPERSPAIPGSKFPEFLRSKVEEKWIRSELERASKILPDKNNPLTSMRIITNDERAVPYFEKLMREYNVPGEVVVRKETDIIDEP